MNIRKNSQILGNRIERHVIFISTIIIHSRVFLSSLDMHYETCILF